MVDWKIYIFVTHNLDLEIMSKINNTLIGLLGAVAGGSTELAVNPIDVVDNQTLDTAAASLISGLIALLFAEVRSWFIRRRHKRQDKDKPKD